MTNLSITSPETMTHETGTYTTVKVTFGKTTYSITRKTGGSRQYVSVRKVTANPFGSLGKEFATFAEAILNYKNANLKLALELTAINLA